MITEIIIFNSILALSFKKSNQNLGIFFFPKNPFEDQHIFQILVKKRGSPRGIFWSINPSKISYFGPSFEKKLIEAATSPINHSQQHRKKTLTAKWPKLQDENLTFLQTLYWAQFQWSYHSGTAPAGFFMQLLQLLVIFNSNFFCHSFRQLLVPNSSNF